LKPILGDFGIPCKMLRKWGSVDENKAIRQHIEISTKSKLRRDRRMYTSIHEFIGEWNQEAASTQKVLDALTDQSLQQEVTPNDRTLGKIAWHIVASIPQMLSAVGLTVEMYQDADTVPSSAQEIADRNRKASAYVVDVVKQQLTDESLKEVRNVFGMDMPVATFLSLFIKHIIHHRGQLTVLMRQAGVKVPGVYGPAREEWSQIGMQEPAI
jgi:uncharacterized damage-inducible protein DinB